MSGVYDGPDDERIADADEHCLLRNAGWVELKIGTLWMAPPEGRETFGGMYSVDEALEAVKEGKVSI